MTIAALGPTFFRRELVANLMTNAVKYTPQAGKQIEVSWREGRPEANERGPVIPVRDKCSGTC